MDALSTNIEGADRFRVATFEITGRGLQTLQTFQQGDILLSVPLNAVFSASKAREKLPALRSASISDDDALAVYIMYIKTALDNAQISAQERAHIGSRFIYMYIELNEFSFCCCVFYQFIELNFYTT